MRRLVYSPLVQAFVNTDDGVWDISPYIVSGSINRKLNQVSSAQLTLRNPVQGSGNRLVFTEHQANDASEPGPLFHPMDPIIIIMQRLQDQPVQVFTGYVDKAPYIQLYPGVCSLTASCTLKRLLYTQWDAALPSVQQFLAQFGWVSNTSGIWNPTAETQRVTGQAGGQLKGQFNDGSIGALLFAVMQIIGQWDQSTIYIEQLPPQIMPLILKLYKDMAPLVQAGDTQFESLIAQVLGTTGHGSGGSAASSTPGTNGLTLTGGSIGATGDFAKYDHIYPPGVQLSPTVIAQIAEAAGLPGVAFAQIAEGESSYEPGVIESPEHTASGALKVSSVPGEVGEHVQGYGLWQITTGVGNDTQVAKYGGFKAMLNPLACALTAKAVYYDPWVAAGSDPATFPWYGTSHLTNPTAHWTGPMLSGSLGNPSSSGTAQTSKAPTGSDGPQASTAPAANAHKPVSSTANHKSGRSPGGKTGSTGAGGAAGTPTPAVINPIPGFTNFTFDKGIDCAAPTGSAILAPAACTMTYYLADFYQGSAPAMQPLMLFKFDQLPPNAPTQYWYVSEQIVPVTQKVGTHFAQGDTVATYAAAGTEIEIGWGSPTTSDLRYAPVEAHYGTVHTGWGYNFHQYFGVGGGTPQQGGGAGGVSGSGGSGNTATGSGGAAAFSTMLDLPSVFASAEALVFTGKRAFIADSPLFPFVEQLTKASLRSFCSMPNGNFFAFFPDYFGFFGRTYYWEIRDIEIIDARIDFSDDALLTHMAVAGDVTTYSGEVAFQDLVLTAGIFDINDAISTGYVGNVDGIGLTGDFAPSAGKSEAIAFLQKYGARPYVEEVPAIRSPFFELFLAFQNFLLAWSKQFLTTFELTFMPELFPGGLVALPDHHLQLYIEEVQHTFDYQQGFTTMVNVSSPSAIPGDANSRSNLSLGLARKAVLQTDQTILDAIAKGINAVQVITKGVPLPKSK